MLGAEMDRELAEPLLEARAPAAAHDVDVGLGKRGEVAQERADLARRDGEVGMELELAQRPVVVEHDRARPGLREPAQQPLLHLALDVRRLPPSVALRVAPEPGQEAVGPLAAVERLDALGHRLQPAATLGQIELERRPQRLDDAVDVPRVDEHRAGQHLRRARELGEEQRAAPAPRQPRLRLAEDELVRDEVHPVAERRHHHHVRPPVERDEPLLRDVAVQVLDRRDPGLSEAAVDAGDQELDLVPLLPELGALEARRHEHLQHRRRLGAASGSCSRSRSNASSFCGIPFV